MFLKNKMIYSGLVFAFFSLASWAQTPCAEKRKLLQSRPKGQLEREQSFQDYVIRIYLNRDEWYGSFEILKAGKKVYEERGYQFYISSVYEKELEKQRPELTVPMGRDITNDGIPNLVVVEWSGGAHCCYTFYVFELGDTFRFIQKIDAGNSDLLFFQNIDDEPDLEFPCWDWAYAYWYAPFVCSPAPRVFLKYKNGKYRISKALMLENVSVPPMSGAEFEKIEKKIDEEWIKKPHIWKGEDLPYTLQSSVFNLIYSGNMDKVSEFLDLVWPKEVGGKDAYKHELIKVLLSNPYWPDILRVNGYELGF